MCEKFVNEKYDVMGNVDEFILHCTSIPIKGHMLIAMIEISRDKIILGIERETDTMIETVMICIEYNQIILQLNRTENKNKRNVLIVVSNDEILCNISTTKDGHQEDISEVTKYTEKIRYILLMNIIFY